MLPDIPDTKIEISNAIRAYIERKINSDHPILAQIKHVTQHEGTVHEYQQVGFGMVSEGYRELAVPVTIPLDEIPQLVGERLTEKLNQMASDLGKQQMRMLFEKLDESTEKAGTKIDNEGKPISADSILQMMEMAQVDFDRGGRPRSSLVMHPEMVDTVRKIDEQIKNDPELNARAETIRRKHYESWLGRENNRKLVD